jgi:hypothetical protein
MYFHKHFAWLKYFTYHLVPVQALNYRQHILSPAEIRKVCYFLMELLAVEGGATFMKHFEWGHKLYILGTPVVCSPALLRKAFNIPAVRMQLSGI